MYVCVTNMCKRVKHVERVTVRPCKICLGYPHVQSIKMNENWQKMVKKEGSIGRPMKVDIIDFSPELSVFAQIC